jgi:hypothetical protein
VVHWFAPQLNKISFMDFPLGYYMAAQGSLIVFVVQLFVFVAAGQRRRRIRRGRRRIRGKPWHSSKKGSFIENLPRIYGLYTGGFVFSCS